MRTILLVEDDAALQRVFGLALRARGYTVIDASNGLEALRVAESVGEQIDLVVTDILMPEMDGIEMSEHLRTRNPSMRFIFISGYPTTRIQGSSDGRTAYLAKPLRLGALLVMVEAMLGTDKPQ